MQRGWGLIGSPKAWHSQRPPALRGALPKSESSDQVRVSRDPTHNGLVSKTSVPHPTGSPLSSQFAPLVTKKGELGRFSLLGSAADWSRNLE